MENFIDEENDVLKNEKNLSVLDEYWEKFIKETGRDLDEKCAGDLNFESKGFSNDSKVALILMGKKTAMFSSFPTFSIDNEPLPASGELYLVLDKSENPVCVIELESVNIVPFNEVTFEMAKKEGEDENLEEWRERTQETLEEEAAILGFDFTPEIRLVFQTFRVVYK